MLMHEYAVAVRGLLRWVQTIYNALSFSVFLVHLIPVPDVN